VWPEPSRPRLWTRLWTGLWTGLWTMHTGEWDVAGASPTPGAVQPRHVPMTSPTMFGHADLAGATVDQWPPAPALRQPHVNSFLQAVIAASDRQQRASGGPSPPGPLAGFGKRTEETDQSKDPYPRLGPTSPPQAVQVRLHLRGPRLIVRPHRGMGNAPLGGDQDRRWLISATLRGGAAATASGTVSQECAWVAGVERPSWTCPCRCDRWAGEWC
jgi:hypothetical protein